MSGLGPIIGYVLLVVSGVVLTTLTGYAILKVRAAIGATVNRTQVADSNEVLRLALADYKEGALATAAQKAAADELAAKLARTSADVMTAWTDCKTLNGKLESTLARMTIERADLLDRIAVLEAALAPLSEIIELPAPRARTPTKRSPRPRATAPP